MKKRILHTFLTLFCAVSLLLALNACSEPPEEESYLSYALREDGKSYAVVGLEDATVSQVVIPKTYRDLPVTSIGEGAFFACNGLTSVTIPDSIKSIGDWGFYGCSGLSEITLPDGLTSIGDYAFSDCVGLTGITIPDSVTRIGNDAFSDCTGLTRITIGKGVTSIGDRDVFYNCPALTEIKVAAGNPVYHSAGNCLIETASKTLLLGCNGSLLPTDGSVTAIGDHAFFGCADMTDIILPDSITSIGARAFEGCEELSAVYYVGTPKEWEDIAVGKKNELLVDAEVSFYSESAPTEAGNYWHYVKGAPKKW